MHPIAAIDLVLRDHERRLAEASTARERWSSRSSAVRAARSGAMAATAGPPDAALLLATLLRSTLGATAR
ncbi:MAG: hypothetical protein ACOH17_01300 [Cellulomonas sp.]